MMQRNDGVPKHQKAFDFSVQLTAPEFTIIPRGGRFLVCKQAAAGGYIVLIDCPTHSAAKRELKSLKRQQHT